jgi:hypothetical protein
MRTPGIDCMNVRLHNIKSNTALANPMATDSTLFTLSKLILIKEKNISYPLIVHRIFKKHSSQRFRIWNVVLRRVLLVL